MIKYMKRSSTLFLKLVLVLIALVALCGLVWFPQTEGRATNLDLISTYYEPFIIYIYITSVPFFVGLYQAFKLLTYIEQNKAFSQSSVNTLRNMKYCALAFIGFIAVAVPYIAMFAQDDDAPGVVVIPVVVIFASAVIATAAGVFQRLLQSAVDIKSENDLTV